MLAVIYRSRRPVCIEAVTQRGSGLEVLRAVARECPIFAMHRVAMHSKNRACMHGVLVLIRCWGTMFRASAQA